jgi:hypothetical protein
MPDEGEEAEADEAGAGDEEEHHPTDETIFMWHEGDEPGSAAVLYTKAGSRLKAYCFTLLGHADGEHLEAPGGDVYRLHATGSVPDRSYDPWADGADPLHDISYDSEKSRASQPVRTWLRERDMLTANLDTMLAMWATEHGFALK